MANSFAEQAMRALSTADGKSDSRRRMMQAVRAACRRLGVSDDDRREIQLALTGKASMTEMELADLGKVLDSLNRDWKGPSGHRAHIGKIRALWWTLYWLGAVDVPKDVAIDAFVRRQSGISALRFLDHRSAASVVEALKSWAAREGVAWQKEPGDLGDREEVLHAIWRKLRERGTAGDYTPARYVAGGLGISANATLWSRHEWDAAIRLVGKRLRREMGRA